MLQPDGGLDAVGECSAKVIVLIVIHQSAGIYAHTSLALDDHSAGGAHERRTRLSRVVASHAVFGDVRYRGIRSRNEEVGEGHDVDIVRDSDVFQRS